MLQSLKRRPGKPGARALTALRYRLEGLRTPPAAAPPEALARKAAACGNGFREISFTFAAIALAARVACADGPPTAATYAAFRESFPLKGRLCGKLRALFALACGDRAPAAHYAAQIRHSFPDSCALAAALLDRLFRIAAADGIPTRRQERLLSGIAHRLGVPAADYAAVRARYAAPGTHEVLGVSPRASDDAVKQRYRELMRLWHPDRFAGETLSPEVALLLKTKTAEINEAYRRLRERAA